MQIYLVRHGLTKFNVKRLMQGLCDSPLTQEGINDAIALGKALADIRFVAAYSSTSERAVDTCDYVLQGANQKFNVVHLKSLRELSFGDLEGEKIDEVSHPGDFYRGYEAVNGETKEMCQERMLKTLDEIADNYQDGIVLVVSHGWSIRCALRAIDEKQIDDYYHQGNINPNCSVSIIEKDQTWKIIEAFNPSYVLEGRKLMEDKKS